MIRLLTRVEWPEEATVELDEKGRQLYFVGWQERPLDRQLFRVSLDGGEAEPLTRWSGMHGAVIAPDFSSYVSTSDYLIEPPNINVVSLRDQKVTRVIHSPSEVAVDYPPPELHSFRTSDGVELFAAVYRPSEGGGRAPVVVSVYGGPGPQMVNDSWTQTVDLRAQMLAQQGFVVLKVDNRGSPLTHVDRLRGKLLMIHGMIDENVHFRHTARLMQALIDAGKPFETLLYPNERHMPRSERDRVDMERRILEFFQRNL